MEDKYTKKLEERLATSREVVEAQKAVDGRDGQIARRLPLDGSARMEGPLLLKDTLPPAENHHAVSVGWIKERSKEQRDRMNGPDGLSQRATNYAGDVEAAWNRFQKWQQQKRKERNNEE